MPDLLTHPATWMDAARQWLGSECAVCRRWQERRVCATCSARFAAARWRCTACGLPVPDGQTRCGGCLREAAASAPPIHRTVVGVDYTYPWDQLIGRFKFADAIDLADPLAQLLATAVESERRLHALPAVHLLVALPLGQARLRERGYNQAWLLARALGRRLSLPVLAGGLLRLRDTAPQHPLDHAARQLNVQDAFAVSDRSATVRGVDVALVDDVMTSGATLRAAALALRRAGAAQVQAWVLARTPPPG